jgi:iron-sulfur cluster assembly protein
MRGIAVRGDHKPSKHMHAQRRMISDAVAMNARSMEHISMTETTTIPTTESSAILLSESAAREIRNIIQQQELDAEKIRLRVGVKGGGCSGFSYLLDLTETQKETDEVYEQHGIKIVIDPKSLLYLNGTKIDFKDEIMGRGFVFNNPNATSSCGCGSSFSA